MLRNIFTMIFWEKRNVFSVFIASCTVHFQVNVHSAKPEYCLQVFIEAVKL